MKPCECLNPIEKDGETVFVPCGGEVPNKRSFRPGHDAKLKSALQFSHRKLDGVMVILDGGMRTETTARKLAKERNWTQFLTDAKPAKAKGDGKDNTGVDHADDQPDAETFAGDRGELDPETLEPQGASRPARVKVRGAWKDGYVTKIEAGETTSAPQSVTVTYQNAKRKNIEVTLPSDSDKLQLG